MRSPAAPSSTLPRDLSLGAALGSLTRAFCAISTLPRWSRCPVLEFDCSGDGLEARKLIDSAALMGACFQAKCLASDLDLIWSSGSLPVQPGISGLGHYRSPRLHINLWASDRSRSTADIACDPSEATKSPLRSYGLVGGPTCRGPWSNVCSRRDRAGAPGPNPPDEFHQSCPKLNPRPFAFRIHSAAVRDLTHPARKRTLAVAAFWLVI